mmetsp:Transcript_26601/g.33886  ORF Transcript_26601/g.33886 Transcript_26601/m.33886 type:complete len:361 (-) Transcript_26601:1066-2148(-)
MNKIATTKPTGGAMKASDFGQNLPIYPRECKHINHTRQRVLLDTLHAFEKASATQSFHKLAMSNLERWRKDTAVSDAAASLDSVSKNSCSDQTQPNRCKVEVVPGDWGVVTLDFTKKYGEMFAVLNMANAYRPGGGYARGCPAQEENMFRRTDCHFSIDRSDKDVVKIKSSDVEYTSAMTNFLNGAEGKVYLDTASPRVCIRGPEDITTNDECDIGYKLLPEESVFPFMELRAAAVDRRGCNFISKELNQKMLENMRCRIIAQLVTLMDAGVRHVILSAFGCGAFRNPADDVAVLYREEIEKRATHFDVVVFAIFHAGYGPDNFTPFQRVFEGFNGDDGALSSAAPVDDSERSSTPPCSK